MMKINSFLGHENVTKLLVENGADANARDIDDRTPLYYSIFFSGDSKFFQEQ